MADDFRLDAPGFFGGLVVEGHGSTTRSTRALLTSLALRRKPSGTSNSTPQPRAPPAELAVDVAGGSSQVGLEPSHSGRLMVGCLGGLFASGATPHHRVRYTRWWSTLTTLTTLPALATLPA